LSNRISVASGGGTNESYAYLGDFRWLTISDRQRGSLLLDPHSMMDTGQLRLRVHERVAVTVVRPSGLVRIKTAQFGG
jgi:hypothetical protein